MLYVSDCKDKVNEWKIKIKHVAEEENEEFVTLRNLLAFYIKRDNAQFKVLARGSTIQRLFERYPELLI